MVKKSNIILTADSKRVILRFFDPGSEFRVRNIIGRILNMQEGEVEKLYDEVEERFSNRHRNFEQVLLNHFNKVEKYIPGVFSLSENRKLLIGSYFSKEYSISSAALFNPSIVPHPDQTGLNPGELRFIMSLRAVGEGHISSIEFRSGIIDAHNSIQIDPPSRFASLASAREERVETSFTIDDELTREANYNIFFTGEEPVSERVIFPFSRTESNGIEDVRFVKFFNDDGTSTYYGTFTAYDGHRILSQIIRTDDFIKFEIRTLQGDKAKDKGMASFPKKINGKYTIISRIDGENLYFMQSDDLYKWEAAEVLRTPLMDWEFVQIGNCGSPHETEKGWLLITHGVGPMRRYVISAILLDKNNPAKIIGYLKDPLIEPDENEREGYVPNVVYSCGGLIHNHELIIPYAMSDSASSVASIPLEKILGKIIPI